MMGKGRREEPCALGGEAQLQDNLGAGCGWRACRYRLPDDVACTTQARVVAHLTQEVDGIHRTHTDDGRHTAIRSGQGAGM